MVKTVLENLNAARAESYATTSTLLRLALLLRGDELPSPDELGKLAESLEKAAALLLAAQKIVSDRASSLG